MKEIIAAVIRQTYSSRPMDVLYELNISTVNQGLLCLHGRPRDISGMKTLRALSGPVFAKASP